MKKLRLDVEALAVDSFATSASHGRGDGTVRGNVDPEATFQTLCVTDVGQCETYLCRTELNYTCDYTCNPWQKSCDYTWCTGCSATWPATGLDCTATGEYC